MTASKSKGPKSSFHIVVLVLGVNFSLKGTKNVPNRTKMFLIREWYSDFDCAFMVVWIKVALASITLWFTSKERPIHFNSKTILFNRSEASTSSEDLAIDFEFALSAELEQNQSFNEFPIGGVPIVCHFASPLEHT